MAINLPPGFIEPILDALPIDITFIDAEDTVRYFNRLGRRIFPRTPDIIGRKVQDCHPRKSLHKVEEILDGFKRGTLDKAEFWIEMRGIKVYIRYFPVRDSDLKYLGCLEVSQDITAIQGIRGEKRLL